MTRIDYRQSGLTTLLDALERELLSAHADEVRDALRETGRTHTIACLEVRALLNEAVAASEEGSAATLLPTPALNWIGILAFGDRFDLRLAAILARTPFLLGTAVGTNGKSRFCQPE